MQRKPDVAKQTYYFEKEHNDCLSCGEDIKNPLCPYCICQAFEQWLEKFPKDSDHIKSKMNTFLKHHELINGKSKTCISCNKKSVHVCPNCFTKHLYNLVKEAGLGVRAMAEFLFMFNFDFKKKETYQELEVLGGY